MTDPELAALKAAVARLQRAIALELRRRKKEKKQCSK
jgi:hypothetical protein